MGVGAVLEPLVVVTLLFGGTWVNRNRRYRIFARRHIHDRPRRQSSRAVSPQSSDDASESPLSSDSLLEYGRSSLLSAHEPRWHRRQFRFFGYNKQVATPNNRVFQDRFLSRLLKKFPFLVEAWYWALIYWVYQIGRAITALALVESTVDVARHHALQIVHLEQRLHLFHEQALQRFFLDRPYLMLWTNRIYSFIHIPGTILFLVWLYHYTTKMEQLQRRHLFEIRFRESHDRNDSSSPNSASELVSRDKHSLASMRLYQARRRTMATCNLLAFIIFTAWPCMPPRLLSDKTVEGPEGREGRSYGFTDTVHGEGGESSVWTENKFCNQYAAMPSLHFGYSLLIGLTVLTIPLPQASLTATNSKPARPLPLPVSRPLLRRRRVPCLSTALNLRLPSAARILTTSIGLAYPSVILLAIIATANHFILDAVAGAIVCGIAWSANDLLLNLLPLEDWFLWALRISKPDDGAEALGYACGEDENTGMGKAAMRD